MLRRAQRLGLAPQSVLDVGAAYGDFSRECAQVFASAHYVLLEPLREYASSLDAVVAHLRHADHLPAVASSAVGEVSMNVHSDLVGSSILDEAEPGNDGVGRRVPATTIDTLVGELDLSPPHLLSLDVQGAELEVLRGCQQTLPHVALAVVEVSFFPFFRGGSEFAEIVEHMAKVGFVVYDVMNLAYRPLDGALAQADVVFVPRESPLRTEHAFATPEQRAAQNEAFARLRQSKAERPI